MLRAVRRRALPAALAGGLVVAGCGSHADRRAVTQQPAASASRAAAPDPAAGASPPALHAHPQAIEPTAGVQATPATGTGEPPIGDPHAHAPSLATVKRELIQLNMCGGTTDRADAAPVAVGRGPGFVADPGTSQTQGELPRITADLDALGKALGVTIYGISGYRSPAHSVAVGGFADDPHTRGEAEDIGVNSLLRSSAAQISESELAQFGLYRPFDPSGNPRNTEVNHVQLIPNGGPLPLAQAQATWDPDPSCR